VDLCDPCRDFCDLLMARMMIYANARITGSEGIDPEVKTEHGNIEVYVGAPSYVTSQKFTLQKGHTLKV
jgi:hypothetical protein